MIWVIAWLSWSVALLPEISGAVQDKVPKIVNVKAGGNVIFECDAGTSFDLISWKVNSSTKAFFIRFLTTQNMKPYIATNYARRIHVVNESAILMSSVSAKDAGRYQCTTVTSLGSTAGVQEGTPIDLRVQVAPFLLKLPLERITAVENASISMECHFEPRTKPEIEWIRVDGRLPSDRAAMLLEPRSSLVINRVATSDAGRYRCYAANDYGSIFHEFDIVVERTSPQASKTTKVAEGKIAVLRCETDSDLPASNVIYRWTKDNKDLMPNSRRSILVSGSLFLHGVLRVDSGEYRCTAMTYDPTGSGIVRHSGPALFLDVQYPPDIIVINESMTVGEGTDARLPCVSRGNPATDVTKWIRGGEDLTKIPRFAVLEKGTLMIRKVRRSDIGIYECTPSNSIGSGKPRTTRLLVQVVPKFKEIPPSVVSIRLGEDVRFKCSAISETVTTIPTVRWRRVGKSFSNRTMTHGGSLVIENVRREDNGEYQCVAVTKKGKAVHTTTLTVIATPAKPTLTAVRIIYSTAAVTWLAGYDGGYSQKFEVWYRQSKASDSQWKNTPLLPLGTLTHEIPGLEEKTGYYFAVRGVNKEGVGEFSELLEATAGGGSSTPGKLPVKPLPPTDVVVNITSSGFVLSWKHDPVPGRPRVEKFVVEYRRRNTSAAWVTADNGISGNKRMYLLKSEYVDPKSDYEFRVFAYGNAISQPAYVSKTYHIATPVIAKRMANDDVIPIVAGVLGAIAFLVLIGLVCFCFVHVRGRKKGKDNSQSKKVHFVLPNGTTQTFEGETDDDFCDSEIKLMPEAVRFVPDIIDRHMKRQAIKEEDMFLLSSQDEPYGGQMLRHKEMMSESSDDSPIHSPRDRVRFFGEPSGWYDCTLSRPASREVRDSYDQFCSSPTDAGSRDSLDRVSRKRALYEHKGSKINLVKKFDSNSSLQFDKGVSLRGSRFNAIEEEGDFPSGNALRHSQKHSHHWSTPEFFRRKPDDSNNNKGNKDSDTDSLDSFGRGQKRRVGRPSSFYEGFVSQQPELVPITEQDSEPSFKCLCEDGVDDQAEDKEEPEDNCDHSSYLHLERTDSQKLSFVDQLKSWENESEGSIGQPYDRHERTKAGFTNASDSDNSVSPAHSLVSLSDSDVDAEIGRRLREAGNEESKRLSFVGEPDKSHLFRAESYIKGVDSGSASDTSELDDKNVNTIDRERRNIKQSPLYKDKRLEVVTNLKDLKCTDSLDQLKVCDPFYKGGNAPARSPSNASSGVFSAQVSSSEDSPFQPRRYSKASARSSTSSSGFETSSSRGSYGSDGFRTVNPGKAHALRSIPAAGRFPHLDEPYEWDREGTGSEFESGSDTGGFSYKPNMIANMRHLLDLQRRLGVDLDSGSSSESLDKEKFEKMSAAAALDFSPEISPTKYKIDRYSFEEKDKRCSKLMEEFKANKRVEDEKLNGSIIYQSWDL